MIYQDKFVSSQAKEFIKLLSSNIEVHYAKTITMF